MSVWVTGARGFIGRYVSRMLAEKGVTVAGLGHGAWPDAEHRACGLTVWLNGDVTHANLDVLAVLTGVPDSIIHLAGGSAVGPSFAQPAEDFRRSVAAAHDLAEWLRLRAPATSLVMASSAAVYGAGHHGPIAESAVCRPYSPYGYHKRMAELVLENYAHNFGLKMAIVRLFSVYGPGLRKQLLWDSCVRLVDTPEALALGGNGTELRDWLHVEDAARLLLAVADIASDGCPVVNGGSGVATPIHAIAESLCRAWTQNSLPVHFNKRARTGDPASLVADASTALNLGWKPKVEWQAGVLAYVKWFRAQGRQAAE